MHAPPAPLARAGSLGVLVRTSSASAPSNIRSCPAKNASLLPGVQLVNTRNHGVAFGFLPGSHVGVTILIGVALLALLVYFARHAASP